MKQKKDGKKIQNWHRPLGPSELRRRFLRNRYDDPEVTNRGPFENHLVEVDDCWDCFDPYEHGPWYDVEWYGTKDAQGSYELNQILSQLLSAQPTVLNRERVLDAGAKADPETEAGSQDHTNLPLPRRIEDRLVEYVSGLMHFLDYPAAMRSWIHESIGDGRNLDVIRSVQEGLKSPHLAKFLCLLSPFLDTGTENLDSRQ